jgi:hypothetical protein
MSLEVSLREKKRKSRIGKPDPREIAEKRKGAASGEAKGKGRREPRPTSARNCRA